MVFLLFLLFFSSLAAEQITDVPADVFLIDGIEASVYGPEGVNIITKSDMERPSLAGGMRTLEDMSFEYLVAQDAQRMKIINDPEQALEAYFTAVMKEHNLSREDLHGLFAGSGYTFEEGREQLKLMQMVNTMLDFKIRSNLIVPRKEIEKYYNKHPKMVEASYMLEHAFVPFSDSKSKKQQRKDLIKYAKKGSGINGIEWSAPFTIQHSDVSDEKAFIYDLFEGDISQPEEVAGGFELFRLKEKHPEHLLTLEERYREISDILKRPRYEALMEEYRSKLFSQAAVVVFN